MIRMRTLKPALPVLAGLLLAGSALPAQTPTFTTTRAPLAPRKYHDLPLGAIRPQGWLRKQLQVMRDGPTGHLDEYYPKIKNDNGWLGGPGDGWEETPYWLDGALPLAWLLDDAGLKEKVKKYVDWSLDHQRPNGFFGPLTKAERTKGKMESCADGEDWWPRMVMLKVLQQYYTATGDKRVIPFMTHYFHYQLASLKTCPLGKWTEWATARGGDNLMSVYWLYNQTGDKALLELAGLLSEQTTPWTQYFGGRNWAIMAAVNQTGAKWMDRHAVNVGMGLKLPVEQYQGKKDPALLNAFRTGFSDLMTLHGLPHGMFSGDEDLHGNEPTQGVELCAIVETMFSLEEAIGITGEVEYMDALERMTYNAMPTQSTEDYVSRQYFQIANQVQVTRGVFDFSLPFQEGMTNVFGPYAGYTCCTANMHQGWTKFANHLWYATADGGLAALEYAPNTLKVSLSGGREVTIEERTNYPFEETVSFRINGQKAAAFSLSLRIPGWCREATVLLNGSRLRSDRGGQVITLNRTWKPGDELTLQLPAEVKTSNWARNSRTLERGPLVYALKIEAEVSKKEHPKEGTYFEYRPKSNWNYGLPKKVIENPVAGTQVEMKPIRDDTFVWNEANAPVIIRTVGKKIPAWQVVEGVARQPVTTREGVYLGEVEQKEEPLTFIPYGCTKLRIVAFPVVK
ncbi:beta-L-arabinofuranosidase domain-containing protein [Larkinella soli]|uniref:beta-L-arabinofuranosidase domain-containing protein n=1 Tax=Larkinella soli TaxID=1770527 RepID=UPI001E37C9C5|nr:beta-L-arabinofuranosidase domain-containing protein [Larkinella soli]